jgi:hypothetical protein
MGENSSHVHLYLSGRFIIMILLLIADKYTVVGFVAFYNGSTTYCGWGGGGE